jgi:hypothetical protein
LIWFNSFTVLLTELIKLSKCLSKSLINVSFWSLVENKLLFNWFFIFFIIFSSFLNLSICSIARDDMLAILFWLYCWLINTSWFLCNSELNLLIVLTSWLSLAFCSVLPNIAESNVIPIPNTGNILHVLLKIFLSS